MGIWIDRMRLAQLGWTTKLQVSRYGVADSASRAIGLWAHSWRWHGRISEVSLHAHAIIKPDQEKLVSTFDQLSARVLEACERAWRDYPDSIPRQRPKSLPDGRIALEKDDWASREFSHLRVWEFQPDGLILPDEETGRYASTAASLSMVAGVDFNDELNPYARVTKAQDTGPRSWQYEVFHNIRSRNGLRIAPTHRSLRTETLDEGIVAVTTDSGCRAILRMFDDYAPGGARYGKTHNGLPPGYEAWPRPKPIPEAGPEDTLEP